MKTNRAGIELIKSCEGCRLTAYKDPIGVLTIGYGHTSMAGEPKVTPGMKITQDQASEILVADLVKYEAAVSKALTRNPNDNQFSAMVSLCYNIGPGNFAKSSVVKYFNAADAVKAAGAFRSWTKAGGKVLPGLVNRREREIVLFNTPVAATEKPPEPVPAPKAPYVPGPAETPPAPSPAPARRPPSIQAVMTAIALIVAAIAAWLGIHLGGN